jgi:hypothetical protein
VATNRRNCGPTVGPASIRCSFLINRFPTLQTEPLTLAAKGQHSWKASTLNQIWPLSRLHEPHFVFMRRTLHRGTVTRMTGSYFEVRAGIASRSCARYQPVKQYKG